MQSLFGAPPSPLAPRDLRGAIRLDGREIAVSSPRDAIAHGIGLVPEDRKTEGLLLTLSLSENITLPQLADLSRYGVVDRAQGARVSKRRSSASASSLLPRVFRCVA